MTRFSILNLAAPTSNEENEKNHNFKFESGEHEYIGNRVQLQFDHVTISGDKFEYIVGKSTLTYGLIVALAGDFYGNYTSKPGVEVEQISDKWDTDPESSIALGIKLAETLSNDTDGYLAKVLVTMEKERQEVLAGQKKGQDVAQVYAGFGDKYDNEFNSDTRPWYSPVGAYAWIALCNWDHFGEDAYKAYKALHTAALRKAKDAHDSPDTADATMVQAYFLEGYAQHFLTDLFSSGHMRTPRRRLHRNFFGENIPEFHPADRCAQKMHNEDCANGLWVRNLNGEGWASYGDKQLFSPKSDRNLVQAIKAAQAGADEVRKTRMTGTIPTADEFAALQLTPVLGDALWGTNYAPLFAVSSDGAELLFRDDVDNRKSYKSLTPMPASPTFTEWKKTLDKIAASGEDKNMYPFTLGFLSSTPFVYLWCLPDTPAQLLDSRFGPLESGSYGSTWTMVDQFNPEISGDPNFQIEWLHAASLSPKVRSLVGRLKEAQGYRYFHVGIQENNVIWNDHTDIESTDYNLRDVAYGRYCSDQEAGKGKIGMIRYLDNAAGSAGMVDVWAFDSFAQAPKKMGGDWQTGPLSFTLSFKVDPADGFQTFLGLDLQNNNLCFFTWTNEYRTQVPSIVHYDPTLIHGKVTALLPDVGCFYIMSLESDAVWVQLFGVSRDKTTGKIVLGGTTCLSARITWGVASPENYFTWFIKPASSICAVTLVMQPDYSLTVVVVDFNNPETPVISNITLDPKVGSLLTAEFMTPLRTMRASYTYPKVADQAAETTEDGIIMFFDNYGILGARMLAPVTKDSLHYELKGQIPAIAGQASGALGKRKVGAITEAIGILPCDVIV